ncbi:hypothetical protein QWY77_11795 [Thalassotalea ponticola]|uniref:hypothetical protein n=1 Tax=Thalassotalea ponticola TaxID=1523392 RepID=UPI0025B3927E|nr:hypothetical protein [Thalassotalea ponticola]MDN3653425.1 hypothetical protein [Thalassotalea ponticola]
MGTEELQKEIKKLLGMLKWSQKRLGRELYYTKYEDDDELEVARFEEKVKKDLSRSTTKPVLLKSYLDLITHHDEFKSLGIIVPTYQKTEVLSASMESGMFEISKMVEKLVQS